MIKREYDFGTPLSELVSHSWDWAMNVAHHWQSPGRIGCELATLAFMGLVTDGLGDDIAATIREARAGMGQSAESDLVTRAGITDLQDLAAILNIELPEDVN